MAGDKTLCRANEEEKNILSSRKSGKKNDGVSQKKQKKVAKNDGVSQ